MSFLLDHSLTTLAVEHTQVAIMCNHQRSVPQAHGAQKEKIGSKLEKLESELKDMEKELKVRRGLKWF